MKRNRKYNKDLVQEKLMNRLKHIVLLLGIGVLIAQEPPEEFQFNQSTQQASYYFDSVTINGGPVESVDWVGVFNGDICVGARQWDTDLCNSGICEVVAMVMMDGQNPVVICKLGILPPLKFMIPPKVYFMMLKRPKIFHGQFLGRIQLII